MQAAPAAVRAWVAAACAAAERPEWPTRASTYRLAGRTLRVDWSASPRFDAMRRALAAIEGAPDRPHDPSAGDLHVTVWGGRGLPPPPRPPWEWDQQSARGDLGLEMPSGIRLSYDGSSGGITLFDELSGRAVWWLGRGDGIAPWDTAAPLRTLLSFWARTIGMELAHSAAVGHPDGVVLLVGRGGSGKTTTSVNALAAGLDFLGDDYVLVDPVTLTAHLVFATAKLDADERVALDPSSCGEVVERRGSFRKRVCFLVPAYQRQLLRSAPIRAVAAPAVEPARTATRVTTLPTAAALRALAASTLLQLSGADAAAFGRLAAVAKQVPTFRLLLGTDRDSTHLGVLDVLAAAGEVRR
jgi:hypothetical protein